MRVGAGYLGCRPYGLTKAGKVGRLGMHVISHRTAHPVRVLCWGAELRTSKQKEEPAPSGYEGKNMEDKSSFQRNSCSSPPHPRVVSARRKQVSPNHHPP